MRKLTIAESVLESRFVDIGATPRSNLRRRLSNKANDKHMRNQQCREEECQLNNASKNAVIDGWRLEVSWAKTEDHKSAKGHEAQLIHAYFEWNGQLPCFRSPRTGKWIRGNQAFPKPTGSVGKLDWEDWTPLAKLSNNAVPREPRRLPHPRRAAWGVAPSLCKWLAAPLPGCHLRW